MNQTLTPWIVSIILLVVLPFSLNYYLFTFRPARRNQKMIKDELRRAMSEREYLFWKSELKENRWNYIPFSDKFHSSKK
ncbi:MAG: hypothetical protein IKA95_06900 [Clostridia bacterium]|nr:hypothetical protein [Clostridia bacterium]